MIAVRGRPEEWVDGEKRGWRFNALEVEMKPAMGAL
jgi:hypothetical protein